MLVRSAVLFFCLATAAWAQQPNTPTRLNPTHLAEMPTPERVRQEITAPNLLDAAARQIGAFAQLGDIIAFLSGSRVALGNPTPDEARIIGEYAEARNTVTLDAYRGDDNLLPVLRRFDEDPALRQELVAKVLFAAVAGASDRDLP